jgi:hypothetical protein
MKEKEFLIGYAKKLFHKKLSIIKIKFQKYMESMIRE